MAATANVPKASSVRGAVALIYCASDNDDPNVAMQANLCSLQMSRKAVARRPREAWTGTRVLGAS